MLITSGNEKLTTDSQKLKNVTASNLTAEQKFQSGQLHCNFS